MFTYKGKTITDVGFFGYGKSNRGIHGYIKKHFDIERFILRSAEDILGESSREF